MYAVIVFCMIILWDGGGGSRVRARCLLRFVVGDMLFVMVGWRHRFKTPHEILDLMFTNISLQCICTLRKVQYICILRVLCIAQTMFCWTKLDLTFSIAAEILNSLDKGQLLNDLTLFSGTQLRSSSPSMCKSSFEEVVDDNVLQEIHIGSNCCAIHKKQCE